MTFKEYLEAVFMEENPTILDDDLPDAFDYWLMDWEERLDPFEDWIKWAEDWHQKELIKLQENSLI